jgi:hypothetical protein
VTPLRLSLNSHASKGSPSSKANKEWGASRIALGDAESTKVYMAGDASKFLGSPFSDWLLSKPFRSRGWTPGGAAEGTCPRISNPYSIRQQEATSQSSGGDVGERSAEPEQTRGRTVRV